MIDLPCLPLAGRRSSAVLHPFCHKSSAPGRLAILRHSSQPTGHVPPNSHVAWQRSHTQRGGNLARSAPFAGPFLSLTLHRFLRRVSCNIRLSSNARSVPDAGMGPSTANRADCTTGRGRNATSRRPRPLSILLGEAREQFLAHHADRDQPPAASAGMVTGGAGLVMRCPAHPSITLKVDDPAHGEGSIGFSSRKQKPMRRAFAYVPKSLWQTGA